MTRGWAGALGVAIVLSALPVRAQDERVATHAPRRLDEREAQRAPEREGSEEAPDAREPERSEDERSEDGRSEHERSEDGRSEDANDEDANEDEPPGPPCIPPRPIPDYGRPPPPPDVADALLWIPRILFFPLHLVIEYGLRRPIGWLLRTVELERLDALFVQGMPQTEEEREAQWWFVPRLRYDHGFQPTIGLGFRAHDRGREHALRLRLEGWPADQIFGLAAGSVRLGEATLGLELSGGYRTDRIFHGLGWSSPDWTRSRYAHARGDASLFVETRPWRRSRVVGGVRAGVHRFEDSDFAQGEDSSIDDAIALGNVMRPPSYPRGYTLVEPWVRGVLDTRATDGWPHATGVRAELYAAWGMNAEVGARASWARVGGSLDVALEVLRDRTLRFRGLADFVEPLTRYAVPFTEQVWLGGSMDRMPGFLEGRLIGLSAAAIGISWRYGIWSWMDAELFVDTGNVFGAHLEDFALDRLRLSFGTALVTRDPDDFTLLLAFGTDPFVNGTSLTSVRFAVTVGAPP